MGTYQILARCRPFGPAPSTGSEVFESGNPFALALGALLLLIKPGIVSNFAFAERRTDMDSASIVRIVAGVLLVIVVGLLIQRRRARLR